MNDIKRCARCYAVISCLDTSDWFSHLSIKYCDTCREIVKKEQNAKRVAACRKRKKEADKAKEIRLKNLELENEILRAKIESLWKVKV